ncbi:MULTISPECIES: spore-associated protein A [unclassified Micromonospora]|uniref:spore-associated protein A n=1 Tax=unclassified Micromonospora TaxID=2617518 RepID=UPI0009393300|nr:spore-associated protein A [Micromonospora sp. CB01531]OKI85876.1 spore-associated protein A [Micromonospora sp. CB01531]
MRISKKIAALGLTAAAATAGALVNASPAYAALYGGQCGSGYGVVNLIDLPDLRGTVYLTYSSSTGKNCVVTIREKPGTATLMEAYLRRSGTSTWQKDSGNYTTYAGPVYVSAAGSCVDWGGTIGTASKTRTGTNCG